MEKLGLPYSEGRAYAFHMQLKSRSGGEGAQGIELYVGKGEDDFLAQAFYAPELDIRVNSCMITIRERGVREILAISDLSSVPFQWGMDVRQPLTREECKAFESRGLRVVSLDRIN